MKRILSVITAMIMSACMLSACHDCPPTENHDVSVDAGINQVIQLPTAAASLQGTVLSGATSTMTYAWTQLSGPGQATILSSSTTATGVEGLVAGTYVFQFAATNSYNNTGIDTVSVVVTSAQVHTLELQPANNPNETAMVQTFPNNYSDPSSPEFIAEAWTSGGATFNIRSMVQFDLSSIPAGSTITSASLSLFTNHTPLNGNLVDANFGSSNQMYIGRIVQPWTPTTLWQDQPSVDVATQLLVPQSTSSFEDLIDFDVTSLVNPMFSGNNYGFKIYLQNEVTYNSRIYCSSKNADATKHPKLVVTYF
ncbi:MAG: DNRLRE domain-containing protein [Bacteroidetes bacterium]|nr:DNRLRE domain-containing protein [Bacteroidota bacterium]